MKMKLFLKLKRIKFQRVFLTHLFLWVSMFLLSGQMNIFANDELTAPATNQTRTVQGIVTDDLGDPLPGVNVTIKGTTTGVMTGSDGSFSISVPNENAVLVFSYIGFVTQEITVGNQRNFNITMREDTRMIEEILVIGYGTQSREMLTTSITKLDNKVLENVPFSNPASALQGSISGVRVQSISGQPGAAPRIIVRGGTSINSPNGATPLYIIDGVIRTDMNNINTTDIESIQVLKDAAATSIYGARGSNGVVIVKTKSGNAGKTSIDYNYNLSFSNTSRTYKMASARDFIYFTRLGLVASTPYTPTAADQLTQALAGGIGNDLTNTTAYTPQYLSSANEHKLKEGWESMPDPLDPSQTIIFKGTDWNDVVFRTGISQSHSISASGGNEKATFIVGLGLMEIEGIGIQTDYTRYTVNLGGTLKARDNLQIGGKLLYSYSGNHTYPNIDYVLKNGLIQSQTTKYKFEDGSFAPGRLWSNGNPEYYLSTLTNKNSTQNLSMSVDAQWDILPGLSFMPQLAAYQTIADGRTFYSAYWDGPTTFNATRNASGSYSKLFQIQFDALLSYIKSLEKHNFDAKAGYAFFGVENQALSASGREAASDLIPTLNASAVPVAVSQTETHQVIIGYFARINYNFDQKYLLSLSARYDGASNLGDNYKWGFFPGVSVGWNVHREDFWSPVDPVVSRLKLRGSYGVNGNISGLGPYQAQGAYSVGSIYDGEAAIQNTTLANQDLKWEQAKTFDLGFDLGLLNNRVTVIFDWYQRKTENLLATLSLPHSSGFAGITTNLGVLENKGIDLELTAQIFPDKSRFQWEASFNVSTVKNTILTLPYNGIENNRTGGVYIWDPKINDYAWLGGLQEGGTMGDLFTYKQLSVYATDEEAALAPVDNIIPVADKTKHGGDVNWLDSDGNGIINDRDRVYVGNIYPKVTGGFSNYLSYMGFGLSVRLDYTLGHTIYNETAARILGNFSGQAGLGADITKSWQKQGDITDIPRYYWADQNQRNNLYRGNSRYYQKGDFLCIREVSLSYNIPRKLLDKLRISNLRFNVTGNNLHYFTKTTSLNPEEGDTDNGRYPMPRDIIFGLHLSF